MSSYGLGDGAQKLPDLVGESHKAAVIANACDFRDATTRRERLEREFNDLASLGFEPEEIDLRRYFDGSFSAKDLEKYGLVWVRGGNVFNLRRAMRYSGFDDVITELLRKDTIVYGGYSAGACVLAPSLHGIELCDPPQDVPDGYRPEIVWDGLGVVPYAVAPHYKSNHPETEMIDDVVAYFEEHDIKFRTLRDGETIVVD